MSVNSKSNDNNIPDIDSVRGFASIFSISFVTYVIEETLREDQQYL